MEMMEEMLPEVPQDQEEDDQQGLIEYRACFNCRIVRFYHQGCPNCEKFMKFKNNIDRVVHCSSLNFGGLFQMEQPFQDFGCLIRPVERLVAGLYVSRIYGVVPNRFLFQMISEDNNEDSAISA